MKIQAIRLGSNPSLTVQLYDGDTESPLALSGPTGFGASAKMADGTKVTFSSAVVVDAANGKVKLDYASNAFTKAGTYDVDVTATDGSGKSVIYPYERGTLKLRVDPAN